MICLDFSPLTLPLFCTWIRWQAQNTVTCPVTEVIPEYWLCCLFSYFLSSSHPHKISPSCLHYSSTSAEISIRTGTAAATTDSTSPRKWEQSLPKSLYSIAVFLNTEATLPYQETQANFWRHFWLSQIGACFSQTFTDATGIKWVGQWCC